MPAGRKKIDKAIRRPMGDGRTTTAVYALTTVANGRQSERAHSEGRTIRLLYGQEGSFRITPAEARALAADLVAAADAADRRE